SIHSERRTVAKTTAGDSAKRDRFMLSPYRTNGPRDQFHRRAGPIVIDCYREGWFELLLTFEPVVVASESMTIWVTSLVSGSINMIRSGSFTNSRFFTWGT